MDFIFSASIIAAFFAGMVALFAPCCITVLLPAYLASAFREKKHMMRMTFVFFAGIAVVLMPIGLGAAGLAKVFENFHRELYIVGGIIMVMLAISSAAGKGFALIPMPRNMSRGLDVTHSKSVFLLGIFSGAATSCCAPVLAGAITLAIVSATFWKAIIVTFAYIFGMTFPLFIAALVYDRYKLEQSAFVRGRLIGSFHSTNLLAGLVFFVMGVILLVLARTGNVFWAPHIQVTVGKSLSRWSEYALRLVSGVPDSLWVIIIIGVFIYFIWRMTKSTKI